MERNRTHAVSKRPELAATICAMSHSGDEIRDARRARGLSQEDLARLAGVSAKTISRIERGAEYDDPRSLPVIRAALGLDDNGLDLSKVPIEELAGELVRRAIAAQRILDQTRLGQGDAPEHVLNDPGTLRGPEVTQTDQEAEGGDR